MNIFVKFCWSFGKSCKNYSAMEVIKNVVRRVKRKTRREDSELNIWLGLFISHEIQVRSSLWSLKRDVWIDGPEMPEHLIKNHPCATALNDTVVVFINFDIDTEIIRILAYDFSKGVWYPISMPSKPSSSPDYFNLLCTCATKHDKTHRL